MTETHSSDRPFFVLGAQRSGTTMLRLMLNSHPGLSVPHESKFILPFYLRLSEFGDLSHRDNMSKLLDEIAANTAVIQGKIIKHKQAILDQNPTSFAQLIATIFDQYAESAGKARWGDKTPSYTAELDVLVELFPNARFIHLIRDGRGVMVSHRSLSWGSRCVPKIAQDWKWKTLVCHKIGKLLGPKQYLEIKYEDLVLNPEAVLKEICLFIDEPYDASMLDYSESAQYEVPAESMQWHQNSIRSPDKNKVHEWQTSLSRADQIIFEQVAGETLKRFGYPLTNYKSNWWSRIMNFYYSVMVRW